MCEPTHSIVQFPDQDDKGDPTESFIDAIPAPPTMDMRPGGMTLCEIFQWGKKKLGSWIHFSKLGFGHSESLGLLSPSGRRYLPPDSKYEALWWNRSVKLDGRFNGPEWDMEDALKCATLYANQVSIGNMTLLRQFLAGSMRHSERPHMYLNAFSNLLNVKGKNVFLNQIKRRFGDVYRDLGTNLEAIISLMMSFTRKRGLLVSEWADDNNIWK